MFTSNRGFDPVDTLLGGMGSAVGRVIVWLGIGCVGLVVGFIGVMFDSVIAMLTSGYSIADIVADIDFGALLKGALMLPLIWLWAFLVSFNHWVGFLYVPIIAGGTTFFCFTEHFEEPLFFLHLIIGPWAMLPLGFELGVVSTLIWLGWTGACIALWWLRSRSGGEVDHILREREILMENIAGAPPIFITPPGALPPVRPELEILEPTVVNVSIPAPRRPTTKSEGDA